MAQNKIIFLDRNENQYGPSPACIKILNKNDSKDISDYSRDFLDGIKSRLSDRLAKEYGLEERNVVLGYGAEDILKQAVHCYIHKGEEIMIPSYSWWYYKKIADEVEGIKVEYPIVEGEDSFCYNIDGMFEVYRRHKPKMVLISSPNNPTGNRLEPDQLKKVLEEMKDAIVVLDEAYTLFFDNDRSYHKEFIREYPNLMIIRTFSKYYALAGLRIGFTLVGENHARFSLFSARYLGFNRLSEKVAIAALDSGNYYAEASRKMAADMIMFFNEFNKIPGFKAYRSYSNFILVKVPSEIKAKLKSYLSGNNIIIKFMEEDGLNSHVRITIGTQEQNRRLMNHFKAFLKENNELA
jgi:histidinol-phosphate aminotransferase